MLVVGAGSSGVQIADELQRSGRQVYLSIGAHDRPPRAYRNRDFCWWLGVLGEWDQAAMKPGREHVTIAVSGAHGGKKRNGLDLPLEPEARRVFPDADCIKNPILELDFAKAGITSIIWATGFAVDYSWLKVDAFDAAGKPQHQRGVSSESGIYFLGLPWQSRRGSSFIWGV
ncbi:putative oxidoreductase CzcO [Pseudomonas fluorescens]|uniref:Putative oxidoreductase CzcO n=1 Tax=Pseudomonas fluorescens TaxID=294 RepID=A0A5E7BBB7_PSEFL|nr:putative oxidoreductase CzcO [Pseudomonas fluorescens]